VVPPTAPLNTPEVVISSETGPVPARRRPPSVRGPRTPSLRLSVTFEGRRIYTTRQGTARQLLVKYDYPPDPEERAVELALEQAELFASEAT